MTPIRRQVASVVQHAPVDLQTRYSLELECGHRRVWAVTELERLLSETNRVEIPNEVECSECNAQWTQSLEASAILAAVREEDDLVSRLESVAMSWCLAGLHDALNRVKRESTKSYADLVDAMRYAMGASAPNPDNANGAGDQRWEDGD